MLRFGKWFPDIKKKNKSEEENGKSNDMSPPGFNLPVSHFGRKHLSYCATCTLDAVLKGESINYIPKYSRLQCPITPFHNLFSKFSGSQPLWCFKLFKSGAWKNKIWWSRWGPDEGPDRGSRRGLKGGPVGGPDWMVHILYQPTSIVNQFMLITLDFGSKTNKLNTEDIIDHRSYTHNLSSCEIIGWKQFRPERDSNPWSLRYQCSALPTELSSHLGAGHTVSS